jgi:hypothetical protein
MVNDINNKIKTYLFSPRPRLPEIPKMYKRNKIIPINKISLLSPISKPIPPKKPSFEHHPKK